MVEDELHDMAHQFTRSLHRAEYQRLQALAASKNATSISEIQRPINEPGLGPKDHLSKLEGIARAKELKDVSQRNDDDNISSDEEEKERMSQWQGTNLGALMLVPGQRTTDLSTKYKIKVATRAAAGFHRGKSELAGHVQLINQIEIGGTDIDIGDNGSRRLVSNRATRDSLTGSNEPAITGIKEHARSNEQPRRAHLAGVGDDEDDDLDALIIKTTSKPSISRDSHIDSSKKPKKEYSILPRLDSISSASSALPKPSPSSASSAKPPAKLGSANPVNSSVFEDFLPIPAPKNSVLHGGGYKGKAMAALAKKREMK